MTACCIGGVSEQARSISKQQSRLNAEELQMKTFWTVLLTLLIVSPKLCSGQVSGNIGYSPAGGKAKVEQSERAKRVLTKEELPPTDSSTFVEANVLMNVKADEYVAVFGIMQDGATVAECNQKMDATVKQFTGELKSLGIGDNDLFVDFITQNKIYGFEVTGDTARQKLVGFELKKNVSIHYKDPSMLEKINVAAARSEIFDLIKVDYIVKDIDHIQDALMDAAARITKNKMSRYEKLLGLKLQPPTQVYAERSAVYYPTDLYDNYTAYETEDVNAPRDRQRYAIQSARKSTTFFFHGLDANGFDEVINPVVTEPVVQFTLYLKLKCNR
jgi:uncharacterized protein YggE